MPAPTDLNSQIALKKGWTWLEEQVVLPPSFEAMDNAFRDWKDPTRELAIRPDYVGTLEGVAGLMRELGGYWVWGWGGHRLVCSRGENCGLRRILLLPP